MIAPVLPTYNRADVAFARGEGAYLFDETGTRYLDFGAGVAVNALGHAHPHLVAALTEQADRLWHTSNFYRVPGQEKLARRLIEATFADTVFFCNSGAEAVECAIKMARKYHSANGAPERFRIVTFEGAFHGRTLATIAAGGGTKLLDGFGPKVDGFDQVPFGDFDAVMKVAGPATAGILIEPIQGEVGIRVAPPGFLKRLREFCDAHGLHAGLRRSADGRLAAPGICSLIRGAGVVPDIMAIAKGIGGGFPLGACLATEKAAKGMMAGTHGSTFGGNPLAMAVGNAVLDVVLAPGFLEHVRRMGCASATASRHADRPSIPTSIVEVRGEGLMLGLRLNVPAATFIERLRAQRHARRSVPPKTCCAFCRR